MVKERFKRTITKWEKILEKNRERERVGEKNDKGEKKSKKKLW